MTEKLTILKKYIRLSVLMAFFSTLVFMLVPFVDISDTAYSVISLVVPIVFWLGLIAEIVFVVLSSRLRKSLQYELKPEQINKMRVGVIGFMRTKIGSYADFVFIVSVTISVILYLFAKSWMFISCLFVMITVFSFSCHCIFNGKNYISMVILQRRVEHNEKK